jgi:hypothetical protein
MTFAFCSSLLFILWRRDRERLSCLERVAEHEEEDDNERDAGHAHLTPLKLRIPRASYRGGGLPQREYI